MSTNQIFADGDNVTLIAPSGGVVSGTPKLIGNLFGIPLQSAAQNENFVLQTKGVFEVAKYTSDVIAQGAVVYWDNSNNRITSTATSNYRIGTLYKAAGSGVVKAWVRLDGISVVAEPGA